MYMYLYTFVPGSQSSSPGIIPQVLSNHFACLFGFVLKAGSLTGLEHQVKPRLAGSQALGICCLCLPNVEITNTYSTPRCFYVGFGESNPDPHAFKVNTVPFLQSEVMQNFCTFLQTLLGTVREHKAALCRSDRLERSRALRAPTLAHRRCVLGRMGLLRSSVLLP